MQVKLKEVNFVEPVLLKSSAPKKLWNAQAEFGTAMHLVEGDFGEPVLMLSDGKGNAFRFIPYHQVRDYAKAEMPVKRGPGRPPKKKE